MNDELSMVNEKDNSQLTTHNSPLVKEGYKQTEVGVIPEDWKGKKLGECILQDPDYGINAPAVNYNENLPVYLRITDITEDGKFSKKNLASVKNINSINYFLGKGDLVFARTGASVGKTYLYNQNDGKLVFAGFLIRVKVNPNILLPEFFKYNTQTRYYKNWIITNSTRTGQPGINGVEYKNLKIPLPPTRAEQTAIATALSDMDALIEGLEKLLVKKRNIKQGAMQELLKPKEGWVEMTLGDCANVIGGGTPSSFNSLFWNGNINWFTPTEVGDSKYVYDSIRKITKEGYASSSAKILPIGTVLLTSRAGIGDLGILMNEGCTNQGFQSLIARDNTDNEFLYYLMHTLKNQLLQNASGSTFLEISPGKLKQIETKIPKKHEQTRIAQILSDMDTEIEKLETQLSKYKMLKTGMMQELLTGKKRLI